jgi:rubrerythrin
MIFAERAEKSPFPNVSRLFKAVAFAEKIHATNHFRNITGKGGASAVSATVFASRTVSEDLHAGIDGETFEVNEMYPVYRSVAQLQGEKGAETTFTWALEAEKVHANLYQKAKDMVDQAKDVDLGPIQICSTCGYTVEGDAPDKCPICSASKDKFRTFA